MKTYNVTISKINKKINTPRETFNVLLDGLIIGQVEVYTGFPHCFENSWLDDAYKMADKLLSAKMNYPYSGASAQLFRIETDLSGLRKNVITKTTKHKN